MNQGGSESSGSSTGGGSGRKRNLASSSGVLEEAGTVAEPGSSSDKDNGKSSGEVPSQNPQLLNVTNKPFRIALLKAMSDQVSECESALSLIPLLQVALVILSELDGNTEAEIKVVEGLMKNLLEIMNLKVCFHNLIILVYFG